MSNHATLFIASQTRLRQLPPSGRRAFLSILDTLYENLQPPNPFMATYRCCKLPRFEGRWESQHSSQIITILPSSKKKGKKKIKKKCFDGSAKNLLVWS